MVDWREPRDKAEDLLKKKHLDEAKSEIKAGLEKFPNQANLLTIATEIFSALGDHEKSLEYAELLITHHPDKWRGYGRAAKDLKTLQRLPEAQQQIQTGLGKFPNQINLLTIATEIYRASGDHEKSLEYAELLITHYPDKWHGYGRAAYRLAMSQELDKAQSIAREGLLKTNADINLISILGDIALAKQDQKMHDKYERLFAKKVFHEDMYSKLSLAPESIKSRLKTEYAQAEEQNPSKARDENRCNLYIVAGFSGCGKSTLLNSASFEIKQIFSPKPNKIKILPIETIKFLGDLETAKKRSHERAMIFGTYFGLTDLPFLCNQRILPKQTLLHIDLTSFFLTRRFEEFTGMNCLTTEELKAETNVKKYISNFFANSFFKKFCSLSIATMHVDFDLNAKRYKERASKSFYFDSSMKTTYKQILNIWHEHLSIMPTAIDNIITEEEGFYAVRQKQPMMHNK